MGLWPTTLYHLPVSIKNLTHGWGVTSYCILAPVHRKTPLPVVTAQIHGMTPPPTDVVQFWDATNYPSNVTSSVMMEHSCRTPPTHTIDNNTTEFLPTVSEPNNIIKSTVITTNYQSIMTSLASHFPGYISKNKYPPEVTNQTTHKLSSISWHFIMSWYRR